MVIAALALLVLSARPAAISGSAPATGAPQANGAALMGDVNCGGTVDTVDALQILRLTAGLSTNAACMDTAGDVDCDGDNDTVDSLRILRHVAGLSNTTPDGCTPIGDPLGPPPSSFDKIDEALTGGAIDSETALLYKVYAAFGDDALPPEYRGDDTGGPPDGGVAITQSMLATVSPQTQALLEPFLVPPVYAESWLGSAGAASAGVHLASATECPDATAGWGCIDAATAGVRTWWQKKYPEDEAKAESIANAMDSTIWPALTGLMGQPLSDAGTTYDGGSGSVDIYLVDAARSMAPDHAEPGCKKTPAYINLARGDSLSVVAHEFMHVLQWGFDVSQGCMYQTGGDYNWLAEATAQWATDFVYPGVNEEHYTAAWYMSAPGKPLDTANDSHEYGAYTFFQYLTELYVFPQIIRTVWDNTAQYGSLAAVEQALPGGLEERWPPFAACLWNAPPSDCFSQWDQLAQSVEASVSPQEVDLGTATSRSFAVAGGVEHMAASYSRFVFGDSKVQSVVFKNTLSGFPHAAVQALTKIDGEWQGPTDWTDRETVSFCRDLDGQHIEELVIIISNDDWENKGKLLPPEQPSLTAGTVGCTDWVGTASAEESYTGATFTITVSGLRFEPDADVEPGDPLDYTLTQSPAATWHVSGIIPHWGQDCTASGEATLLPADGTHTPNNRLQGGLSIYPEENTYLAIITGEPAGVVTLTCPDGTFEESWPWVAPLVTAGDDLFPKITEDGRLIGQYFDPTFYDGTRWEWHFDPAPPLE